MLIRKNQEVDSYLDIISGNIMKPEMTILILELKTVAKFTPLSDLYYIHDIKHNKYRCPSLSTSFCSRTFHW